MIKSHFTQTMPFLITGAAGSGKTEFIRSLSEIEVVSNEMMDYGRVTIDDDMRVILFGQQIRFNSQSSWKVEILAEAIMGIVLAVDSTSPDTFAEAKSTVETLHFYTRVPYVVAANKQDLPGAWAIEELRHALGFANDIRIIACAARDREQTKNVLLELLEAVLKEMESN